MITNVLGHLFLKLGLALLERVSVNEGNVLELCSLAGFLHNWAKYYSNVEPPIANTKCLQSRIIMGLYDLRRIHCAQCATDRLFHTHQPLIALAIIPPTIAISRFTIIRMPMKIAQ